MADALDAITADDSLEEIILSGGDPLALGNGRLAEIIHALDRIPHITRIRLHTRLPVVLPERIDDELLELLGNSGKAVVTVIHANHAQEIDAGVIAALSGLRGVSAALLNQSVLLRGVNDSTETWWRCQTGCFLQACCPTTCINSTALPAPRTSSCPTMTRSRCMQEWPHNCPVTWCRDLCAKAPEQQQRHRWNISALHNSSCAT